LAGRAINDEEPSVFSDDFIRFIREMAEGMMLDVTVIARLKFPTV